MEPEFVEFYRHCRDYTMTTIERMYALYQAVRYVVDAGIPGDVVECGVWRGGSSMLAAHALAAAAACDRTLYLYDTFEGMSEPTDRDVKFNGQAARHAWDGAQEASHNRWCYAPLEEVRRNLLSTGYPEERLRFVKGKAEDTIPGVMPSRIAVLRLDTDLYESTRHELTHLFPLLAENGVLILDDYGSWQGAKEAVDEFFAEQRAPILLQKIDASGRMGLKTSAGPTV